MYGTKDFKTIFDLIKFTVDTMRNSGYNEDEVEAYLSGAVKENNYNAIALSEEYLEECSHLCNNYTEDSWRDSYYSSIYNSDLKLNGDEEFYEGFSNLDIIADDDCWDLNYSSALNDDF